MSNRQANLVRLLADNDLDALIVTNATNIRYATGFTGSNGSVVISADGITLVTDSRYTAWASDQLAAHAPSVELVITSSMRSAIDGLVGEASTIGLEAQDVSWAEAGNYRSRLGEDRVVATNALVESLRAVKDDAEIRRLKDAAAIGDAALQLLAANLGPGCTETQVARQLAQHMFEHAQAEPSFDIIVASGPNAAKPHHTPSDRVLEAGDLVIIDSGATVDGYRSDMTRSFILGSPTAQQHEMLDVVLEAQALGVAAVRPGASAADVDAACRSSIAAAGLGDFFTHGTGHGVGLDIHEAPSVNSASTTTLVPGHVITVEPGVYVPDVGGVRWEDTVVVTDLGGDPITRSPKQPIITL